MKIAVFDPKKEKKSQTLVVFTFKTPESKKSAKKEKTSDKAHPAFGTVSSEIKSLANSSEEVTGTFRETVYFRHQNLENHRDVLFVGLGEKSKVTLEGLRQATAEGFKSLASHKAKSATVMLSSLSLFKVKKNEAAQAMTEGLVLSSYVFDELKSEKNKAAGKLPESIEIGAEKAADRKTLESGIATGSIVGDCINFARYLGDMPGNRMTPTILADTAKKELSKYKIKVTAWDKAKIKQEKMNGLLGVSLGSAQEPRFIIMEYNGAGKTKKPVALVGKGLTFDSGGISIKPSASMEEMKYDMCGGANVIATMMAAARLKLKVNLIGLVPSSENMPGCAANKPGDIFVARNGISVEVNNTDAEGRLILGDALAYASEHKPQAIFDFATLTGAMSIALGNIHVGFYTREKNLVKKIVDSADKAGERVWNMPLHHFHLSDMKGTYADLSNVSTGKGAGSATAAAFLGEFVDAEIPWAHFDIAGCAYHTGDRLPYNPKKGASGVMIRTVLDLVQNWF